VSAGNGQRRWVSAETEQKERDFRGLLDMHVSICRGIRERYGRRGDPPYLFVDLHGGPGILQHNGRCFPGSPLIASDILSQAAIPYESLHFEHDPAVAAALHAAIAEHGYDRAATVVAERFETGIPRWLATVGRQPYRSALFYSDPIKDPIPVEAFNVLAERFPRGEFLAYVAANDHYKRANGGGYGHRRRLADDITAVRKEVVMVREPATAHQWTFLLWTNWRAFPKWERRGFYRVDSPRGRQIVDELNYTQAELHDRANVPLPFNGEPPDPPYRTYREYLRHPRFLKVRAVVFRRAAGRCERCGLRPPTEPHHLRYPPWGEFDVPENLIAVCNPCHCEIHGKAS
jgi:hypothetical protein